MRISDWSSDVCSSDLIYPDASVGVFIVDDLHNALLEGFHGVAREAVKDDRAAGLCRVANELLQTLFRHRQGSEHDELGCAFVARLKIVRGLQHLIEVDRACRSAPEDTLDRKGTHV